MQHLLVTCPFIINTFGHLWSKVLKSPSDWLNYTGFPGDVRVTFFDDPPGNKDVVTPNPLMLKKAVVFTPGNMMWHKMKRDSFLYPSVVWPLGAGLGHSKRARFPDRLPSVWRSSYITSIRRVIFLNKRKRVNNWNRIESASVIHQSVQIIKKEGTLNQLCLRLLIKDFDCTHRKTFPAVNRLTSSITFSQVWTRAVRYGQKIYMTIFRFFFRFRF